MRSFLFALFLVACGGGGGTPDADPPDAQVPDADPGPGSGTLRFEGTFVADNPSNIVNGQNFMVRCSVTVTQDGEPVTDMVIQVSPPGGFVTTLVADDTTPNVYVGTYFSYADTVRFGAYRAGARWEHYLSTLTLEGPDPFQIEMPQPGSIHPVDQDLHVSWGLPDGAVTRADVALESGFEILDVSDSGSYDIPAASLVVGDDEVIVRRWKHNLIPAGAVPGSYIDIAVQSHQPVTLQ